MNLLKSYYIHENSIFKTYVRVFQHVGKHKLRRFLLLTITNTLKSMNTNTRIEEKMDRVYGAQAVWKPYNLLVSQSFY